MVDFKQSLVILKTWEKGLTDSPFLSPLGGEYNRESTYMPSLSPSHWVETAYYK